MHDQPIKLDAGFDHMPHLSVARWLHTIDSRVVSGEPIVIIDDGTTQRVITAPCTGRIVDIYTEGGAHVLPRTVLGMVRPDLIMPETPSGLGNIFLSIILIGLALIAIPIVTNVPPVSIPAFTQNAPTQPRPQNTNQADDTNNSPMPDAPLPGSSPSDDIVNSDTLPPVEQIDPNATDDMPDMDADPNQFLVPIPEDSNTDTGDIDTDTGDVDTDTSDVDTDTGDVDTDTGDVDTDTSDVDTDTGDVDTDTGDVDTDTGDVDTDTGDDSVDTQAPPSLPDNPDEQSASGFMSNVDIDERFMFDVDRIIVLTEEVNRNLPSGVMSQSEYDEFVSSASTEVIQLIDALSQIIVDNRDNTNINEKSRRWFSSFTDTKDDCLTIYVTIRQAVQTQQPIPDLTSSFAGCYVLLDNFE